jgi:hypothetical protein
VYAQGNGVARNVEIASQNVSALCRLRYGREGSSVRTDAATGAATLKIGIGRLMAATEAVETHSAFASRSV